MAVYRTCRETWSALDWFNLGKMRGRGDFITCGVYSAQYTCGHRDRVQRKLNQTLFGDMVQ